MTITLVGNFGGGVNSGNLTLSLPGGISFGDAVGAVGICSSAQTLAAPAGWTVRSGFPMDAGNARFYAWTKDDVTSDDSGASQVWVPSGANKVTVAGFALHSGNGFPADWTDDLTFQAHTTSGTSYDAPSSTSTVDGAYGVAAFGCRGTDPSSWTPASGLTERIDSQRSANGATSLHLCDSNGSIGAASTVWGPYTEANISTAAGGGLTWLVAENAEGEGPGGGGGGGGGGSLFPKVGLWINHDSGGSRATQMDLADEVYGPFQGHYAEYYGSGVHAVGSDVVADVAAGRLVHIYWKPWDTSWADTAGGGYNTEIDEMAADIDALAPSQVWLTLHHEPEDDYDSHGPEGTGWTAANYRGMWSQVRSRFDAAGVTNVTWVMVYQNSHSPQAQHMTTLWGNDGTMDDLVDIVSQQDYIVKGTDPSRIATKWLEDLQYLVDHEDTGRHWGYLNKPQAFTEWGADLGGNATDRGTASHRALTIDAVRGILSDLAARSVEEIRYFDAGSNDIVFPPSVDGIAFQALKVASEQGQAAGPAFVVGSCNARDGLTATSNTITFDMQDAGISGWQPGDVAVVWAILNSNPTMSTEPAGWVLQEGPISNSTTLRAWRYSKTLAAGEPDPSWVVSQSVRGSGLMVVCRGVETSDPFESTSGLTATSSSTSHAAPAITTAEDDCLLLTTWLFRWADASGNGGVNYGTPPGSHASVETVSPNSGANPGAGGLVATLSSPLVAAGSHGPYTATVPVTSTGLCGQVSLRPAAAPSAPVVSGHADGVWGFSGTAAGLGGVQTVPGDVIPSVRVLIAFASDPYSTSPVYTDVTDYVAEPVAINFGAKDEFSDVEPATCSFRLKNPDGRFTMGRTDGPYGAGVLPGKRVLVVLDYGGGDIYSDSYGAGFGEAGGAFTRFDGHMNGFPTSWDESLDVPIADVSATDRMKRLGDVGELRSMLEEQTLLYSPDVYYPLSEQAGAQSVGSIADTTQPAAALQVWGSGGGLLGFGEGTGPGTDGLSAITCTPNGIIGAQYLVATRARIGSTSGCWLSCFFATTETPSPNETIMCALATQGGEQLSLGIWVTGGVQAFFMRAGQGVFGNATSKLFNDGQTHHALVTFAYSGGTATAKLYVDGLLRHTGTYTSDPLPIFTRVDIGAGHLGIASPFQGTISHVAAGSGVLTDAQVAAIYGAGLTGLLAERTDDRMHRVADWAGLPSSERSFEIGTKRMGAQRTDGKSPLDAFRDVERVEQGRVFFYGGLFRFQNRERRYNRPADVTLDVANFEVQIPATYPGDDFGMVNDMEVSRPDGASQRITDGASKLAFGRYADSLEVPAESDNDAQAVGNWRVGTYGTPLVRFPVLTVSMAKLHTISPTKVVQLLQATIGSVIRIENLPDQAPVTDDEQVIEGWTETLGVGIWQMVFNCSPHSVNSVWQLGVAGRSELGDTTRLAL